MAASQAIEDCPLCGHVLHVGRCTYYVGGYRFGEMCTCGTVEVVDENGTPWVTENGEI